MFLISSKESIQGQANNYENLGAKYKTKNGYVLLVIIFTLVNYFGHGLGLLGEFAFTPSEVLGTTIFSLILAVFIYFCSGVFKPGCSIIPTSNKKRSITSAISA